MAARTFALAFAAFVAGTMTAAAATDDEIKQQMVGRWGETAECAGSVLTFNADGTFASGEAGAASPSGGTYAVTGGKLTGKTDTNTMPEVMVSFDGDKMILTAEGGDPETLIKCAQ